MPETPTLVVHYASRKADPCPTTDPRMRLLTACELPVSELPAGANARDDISVVTCPQCKLVHQIWTDMKRESKGRARHA